MIHLALEDVDGALEHPARRRDDIEVGFVGALGVAQIRHLDERIDVRIFDVAAGVGGRIAGLVPQLEIGPIGLDVAELDDMGVERAIELGRKRHDLAPVRVAAGRLRSGIGVGDILGDDLHAANLRMQAGGGDGQRFDKIHNAPAPLTSGLAAGKRLSPCQSRP
jgi:hypothetical protein